MRLLEREHDLEALSGWLHDVAAGQGCSVLVFGEAGIGKTALLRQFAHQQVQAKRVARRRRHIDGLSDHVLKDIGVSRAWRRR